VAGSIAGLTLASAVVAGALVVGVAAAIVTVMLSRRVCPGTCLAAQYQTVT
jgi:hypothetical protein